MDSEGTLPVLVDIPQSQFLPGGMGVLSSTSVTLMSDGPQRCGSLGFGHSSGVYSMTVTVVPWISSTPGEMCVVELDFPRASFPPGES